MEIGDFFDRYRGKYVETFNVRIVNSTLTEAEYYLTEKLEDLKDAEDPTERANFNGFLEGAECILHVLGFTANVVDGRARIYPPGYDADSMTVGEAAEFLGLSEPRVRQLLTEEQPKLSGRKAGKSWAVSRKSAEEYKASHPKRWARS